MGIDEGGIGRAYPGRFQTPTIEWQDHSPSVDERVAAMRFVHAREEAYRKTLKGRIENWIWRTRGSISDFIAPERWNDWE